MTKLVFDSTVIDDRELAKQYGIEISNRSVELRGMSCKEAEYIQTYPLLNGPDLSLNRLLWNKLTRADAWQVSTCKRDELWIELQEIATLPAFPYAWRVPGKSVQELQKAYAATFWGIQFVPEGPLRILQAGSMAGHEPTLMKCLDDSRKILVIDLLLDCARNIKEAGLETCIASIFALPLPGESFDCVYNNNVMEHLYNQVDSAIIEIHRVLKPGGTFSFVMPIESNPSNPDLEFQIRNLGKSRNWRLVDPGHPWKTDLYDINSRLKKSGFQNIRFAFRIEDAQYYARRRNLNILRSPLFLSLVQKLYLAFEENRFFQEIESRARKYLNFYRFMAWRQKLRDWLGLPNRQIETLQVLVFTQKRPQ